MQLASAPNPRPREGKEKAEEEAPRSMVAPEGVGRQEMTQRASEDSVICMSESVFPSCMRDDFREISLDNHNYNSTLREATTH